MVLNMVKYTTGSDLEIVWIYRWFTWPKYPNIRHFDFKGRFLKCKFVKVFWDRALGNDQIPLKVGTNDPLEYI